MIVLGIDAAWTTLNPSGIALVEKNALGWRLVNCCSGYAQFLGSDCNHKADPVALLERSATLAGRPVDLVAVDMPLARSRITGRRASDNEVSRLFGARHCSTHTPNTDRPGLVSDDMRAAFEGAGYTLATESVVGRALIEVYPHTALLALMDADMRLPYKYGKIAKYWPCEDRVGRRQKLLCVWTKIAAALDKEIKGVASAMQLPPLDAPATAMKAFEDTLDAIVCAWVGICLLEGRAVSHGDFDSAIWTPTSALRPLGK